MLAHRCFLLVSVPVSAAASAASTAAAATLAKHRSSASSAFQHGPKTSGPAGHPQPVSAGLGPPKHLRLFAMQVATAELCSPYPARQSNRSPSDIRSFCQFYSCREHRLIQNNNNNNNNKQVLSDRVSFRTMTGASEHCAEAREMAFLTPTAVRFFYSQKATDSSRRDVHCLMSRRKENKENRPSTIMMNQTIMNFLGPITTCF